MRTAFFADVHSNREALTACLAHARERGAERHVYLGDLVGYGADPGWVIDTVMAQRAEGALAIQGNHDAAVWDAAHRTMHPDAERAIDWTRAQLDGTQLSFLVGLPLSIEDGQCLFVHANAWAPAQWGYVTRLEEAKRSIECTSCTYTFCGHVHDPMLYHLAASGYVMPHITTPAIAIPVPATRRWLAITGSVGQPRDGIPAASYAVFDDEAETLTYFRVPYDVESAAKKIRATGLPAELARRLEEAF